MPKPRLNKRDRHLHRFYEPLVLLYTLGMTRGSNTQTDPPSKEKITYLPAQEVRRIFLGELAYVCDYDKGGDTVTAIGLEFTPQNSIFYLASNSNQEKKIVPFLESLLTNIRNSTLPCVTPERVEDIAAQCIEFAAPRIGKYRDRLLSQLNKCQNILTQNTKENSNVIEWLKNMERLENPLDLCHFAYKHRKSPFMFQLAKLGMEPEHKSTGDALHEVFRLVRHDIGRLGSHFRAAEVLLACAIRLSDLLRDYQIRYIPTPPRSEVPSTDGLTTPKGIIGRMLPADSPNRDHYRRMLMELEAKHQLFDRFLENYSKERQNPRIHAEIQVLEEFYSKKRVFVGQDPFIACSKPACYCCFLYFQHHQGHFEHPKSHYKIYPNWLPPGFDAECDETTQKRQKDILDQVNAVIRREALDEMEGKIAPQVWHPDSTTGITGSHYFDEEYEIISDIGDDYEEGGVWL